jgi:hypothetical protein
MKPGTLILVGSVPALLFLLTSSPLRAADVHITAPTGTQVGAAVDDAKGAEADATDSTSESMEKAVNDTANQQVGSAKEKAKSAAGRAIDSVGSGPKPTEIGATTPASCGQSARFSRLPGWRSA